MYSLTITRKAGPMAYALAYVTLEEGITLMSNIVDCDLDSLRIGYDVQVVFKNSPSGQAVPMFKPIK
ncbi:MAG: Zn-ribbon domain-containing OB-fold protein [Burkholderiaceae bacterium]